MKVNLLHQLLKFSKKTKSQKHHFNIKMQAYVLRLEIVTRADTNNLCPAPSKFHFKKLIIKSSNNCTIGNKKEEWEFSITPFTLTLSNHSTLAQYYGTPT